MFNLSFANTRRRFKTSFYPEMKTKPDSISLVNTLVILCLAIAVECKLPASLGPGCPVKSGDWANCIKNAIEGAQPYLAAGNFGEGFIVPKLEPLFIKKLAMESNDVNVTIYDLLVNGPSNFQVKKIKPKLEDLSVESIIHSPLWKFVGKYVLSVKSGPIEINGKGDIRGEFSDINIKFRTKFNTVVEEGQQMVKFQKFQIRLRIGDGKLQLDNLFGGDPVLGEFGNQFINTRTQVIIQHLEPEVERDLTGTFTKILTTLFKNVTFAEMFPQ